MNSGFKKSTGINTHLLAICLGTCLTFVSCIEKFEIPDEFYTENFVLNTVLEPDSAIRINISKSLPPTGAIEFEFVSDAIVKIKSAGSEQEVLCEYDSSGWYSNSGFVLHSGTEYAVRVVLEDASELSSATVIPPKPTIKDVMIENDSIYFSIVDDPNKPQYYIVSLMGFIEQSDWVQLADSTYSWVWSHQYNPVEMQSDDASIDAFLHNRVGHVNNATGFTFTDDFYELAPDYTGKAFLISDQTFQGETKEFLMEITEHGLAFIDSIRTVDLLIHSIDYNYYQYLLTFAQYWTTDEAPFTVRAKMYNNIVGGYGIFGSKNGVKTELTLPDVLFEE